jgi:type IV pilus assembly protein PilP
MRRQQKTQKSKVRGLMALFAGLALLVADGAYGAALSAVETGLPKEQGAMVPTPAQTLKKKPLEELLQAPFTYRRENRQDPFMPFLTEATGPTQLAPTEDAPLSGMQLFEPGQLTLVAILFSGQGAIAMVEDSTGMGHIIRVKDKIGRRGEVKAIVPNSVVIEESSQTTSGSKRLSTTEMVLRKEGDKE